MQEENNKGWKMMKEEIVKNYEKNDSSSLKSLVKLIKLQLD